MPAKLCHICSAVVPVKDWPAHHRRHRDASSERKGGSRPWRRLRARIIERDGGKCVVCGSTENLEVDHKDGNWRNNAPENLRTVCFDHNPRGPKRAQ